MEKLTPSLDPLLVSQPEAMRLLGCKSSKFYVMKRERMFDTVEICGRDMVVYQSLKRLVGTQHEVAHKTPHP